MRPDGVSKLMCGKMTPSRICRMHLTTPPSPAAGSMCPTLVLTDPTTSGSDLVCEPANTSQIAPISIGSPSGGPGAVRLDVLDVLRLELRVAQRGLHHGLLRDSVRDGQTGAGAVLADGRAPDQGEDRVAVAAGVGEPLEDDRGAALRPGVAVGRLVEGLAPPVRRQHVPLGEHHEDPRMVQAVDRGGKGDVTVPAPQVLDRVVQRGERGTRTRWSTLMLGPRQPRK
jgi:hypothetical protein